MHARHGIVSGGANFINTKTQWETERDRTPGSTASRQPVASKTLPKPMTRPSDNVTTLFSCI